MSRSHRIMFVLVLLGATLPAIGCGSSPTPAEEKAAAVAAVQQFVDQDDCSVMSDKYAAAGFASVKEGRESCERDTSKGLQKGDYGVESTELRGSTAIVQLNLKPAGVRSYTLVRQDGDWKVDDMTEEFQGEVGDTFPYRGSYVEDDEPIDEDLRISVKRVDDPAPRPEFGYDDRGKRYIRTKVKMTSDGPSVGTHTVREFQLVDATGRRYDAGADYEPHLGFEDIDLAPHDQIVGYVSFKLPTKAKAKEIRWNGGFDNDSPMVWRLR